MLHRSVLQISIVMLATATALTARRHRAAGSGLARTRPCMSADGALDAGVFRRRCHPKPHTQVQQAERGISPQLVWANTPAATQSSSCTCAIPKCRAIGRRRPGALARLEHTWHGKGLPEGMPEGAELPNGIRQISASGDVYRGPGAPAAGPMHHYTFEVYALDAKLDVPPAADAWETRRNLFKAMDGHVIGKAVMVGMFKSPQ